MKVPQHIKDSISKSALHSAIANEENKIVRLWLDKQGLGENDTIIERLIDSIEIGYYPNEFISFLEEDEFKF